MTLHELYTQQNAALAPDGIPLHFGDLKGEYQAALQTAILLDRSHQGRMAAAGRDRFALPNRMSTNELLAIAPGEGRPTIFTTPNGRIIDRAVVFHDGDRALLVSEPGRGPALYAYLQKNIFFNDDFRLSDLSALTHQFDLHGPNADAIMERLAASGPHEYDISGGQIDIAGAEAFAARSTPLSGSHWVIIVPTEDADKVWQAVLQAGEPLGLRPSGGLVFNALRIRAGRPAFGRELTSDYIPLEVGLWDEVSFSKGCYTGQEIIARMESRGRLAKTLVRLDLSAYVEAPQPLLADGREVGLLTSSVTAPDGKIYALGIIRTRFAHLGERLALGASRQTAQVAGPAGAQPEHILPEEPSEQN